MNQLLSFLTFLGATTVLIPWLSGAYQWLRWGYVGQHAIWTMRKDLDAAVERSLREELQDRPGDVTR